MLGKGKLEIQTELELVFGQTIGVGLQLSVFPFPLSSILLQISLLQWWMFGIILLVMAVGILSLKGPSMIGNLI